MEERSPGDEFNGIAIENGVTPLKFFLPFDFTYLLLYEH
jgi:hypothetical protein